MRPRFQLLSLAMNAEPTTDRTVAPDEILQMCCGATGVRRVHRELSRSPRAFFRCKRSGDSRDCRQRGEAGGSRSVRRGAVLAPVLFTGSRARGLSRRVPHRVRAPSASIATTLALFVHPAGRNTPGVVRASPTRSGSLRDTVARYGLHPDLPAINLEVL